MSGNARCERLKQKAWSMLDAGRHEDAIEAFDECIAMEPFNMMHVTEKGVALYKMGRLDESMAHFDSILEADPKHFLALNNKARILADRGRNMEALAYYQRILDIDPKHVGTWIKAAKAMIDIGRFDKAELCLKQALDFSPDNHVLWAEKASMHRLNGETEKALDAAEKALKLKATFFDALAEKGRILMQAERFKDAAESLRAALHQKNNKDEEIQVLLGNALLSDGRPDEALAAFDPVIADNKDCAAAWEGKGKAFIAKNESARGHVNLGTARMIEQKYNEAIAEFDTALSEKPDYAEALSNKAVALERSLRYEEAADCYARALEIDPASTVIMNNLGMLCINRLERREQGLRLLKNILKYDPRRWFEWSSELRRAVDDLK